MKLPTGFYLLKDSKKYRLMGEKIIVKMKLSEIVLSPVENSFKNLKKEGIIMTKKELIKAVLAGRDVDHIPYSMWSHVPGVDRDPEAITKKTVDFYHKYDVDIIKTMNNGMYSCEDFGVQVDYSDVLTGGVAKVTYTPVQTGEDWAKVQEVSIDEGALKREQTYLKRLLEELKGEEVPVVFTAFSPVTTANKLCGGKIQEFVKEGYGKLIHQALDHIAETTAKLVARVTEMGADGIFFATQLSSFAMSTEAFYEEYGKPYDLKVLEASRGWCNVLHAHGDDIMFDLLKDYPVQVFNYHAWQSLPSMGEAAACTGKTLMCGIERMDITKHHKNAIRNEIYESIRQTGGKHLILAPGCVIRYPLDEEMLAYVKKVKVEIEKALLK